MKIDRKEIIKMMNGAVNKCVPPQETIDVLIKHGEKFAKSFDKKVEILNIVATNLKAAYDISLEEIRKRNKKK